MIFHEKSVEVNPLMVPMRKSIEGSVVDPKLFFSGHFGSGSDPTSQLGGKSKILKQN